MATLAHPLGLTLALMEGGELQLPSEFSQYGWYREWLERYRHQMPVDRRATSRLMTATTFSQRFKQPLLSSEVLCPSVVWREELSWIGEPVVQRSASVTMRATYLFRSSLVKDATTYLVPGSLRPLFEVEYSEHIRWWIMEMPLWAKARVLVSRLMEEALRLVVAERQQVESMTCLVPSATLNYDLTEHWLEGSYAGKAPIGPLRFSTVLHIGASDNASRPPVYSFEAEQKKIERGQGGAYVMRDNYVLLKLVDGVLVAAAYVPAANWLWLNR